MPASETALPTGDVAPRCELAGEWDVEASVRRGRLRLLATRGSSMQGETSSSLSAENMLAPQLDPKLLYDLLLTDRWVYRFAGPLAQRRVQILSGFCRFLFNNNIHLCSSWGQGAPHQPK